MQKQKICIIGGGLTGLVTAIALSKLNYNIDLILGNRGHNLNSNGTIAISQNNFDFLNKLKIFKSRQKVAWPCSKIKLYEQAKSSNFSDIFEFQYNYKKKVFYMIENSIITKMMMKEIKKNKFIKVKNNLMISKISNSSFLKSLKVNNKILKYDLIILCAGNNSDLVNNLFSKKLIKYSYKEVSYTTIIQHSFIKNAIARQVFLNDEILAFLPISNTRTSIVWTVKNNLYKKNNSILKKKIKFYSKNFLKKIKFKTKIECRNLNFLIRNKIYHDRILLFGDALHLVHPFAGQGFNMTLRDLSCLENVLIEKKLLGLDIGSDEVLSEFAKKIQPRNFVYATGIDLIKKTLSYKNRPFKSIRKNVLKTLNENKVIKDVLFNIADRGFEF